MEHFYTIRIYERNKHGASDDNTLNAGIGFIERKSVFLSHVSVNLTCILRINEPIPGMFVLIWMYFSWWFQILSWDFTTFIFLTILWHFLTVVCSRLPRAKYFYGIKTYRTNWFKTKHKHGCAPIRVFNFHKSLAFIRIYILEIWTFLKENMQYFVKSRILSLIKITICKSVLNMLNDWLCLPILHVHG